MMTRQDKQTTVLIAILGFSAGILLLPQTVAVLTSLQGAEAGGYWLLSRASGVMAYLSFIGSIISGLLLSSRAAQRLAAAPVIYALHDYTAWVGLALAGLHSVVLLGDHYLSPDLGEILVPFALDHPSSVWFGMGQLAFYLLAAILLANRYREQLGSAVWRYLHPAAFLAYLLATLHALLGGSDTANPAVLAVYAVLNAVILFFSLYRWRELVEIKSNRV